MPRRDSGLWSRENILEQQGELCGLGLDIRNAVDQEGDGLAEQRGGQELRYQKCCRSVLYCIDRAGMGEGIEVEYAEYYKSALWCMGRAGGRENVIELKHQEGHASLDHGAVAKL